MNDEDAFCENCGKPLTRSAGTSGPTTQELFPTDFARGGGPSGESAPAGGNVAKVGNIPASGNAPMAGNAPVRGRTPVNSNAPIRGNAPAGSSVPTSGNAPVRGSSPAKITDAANAQNGNRPVPGNGKKHQTGSEKEENHAKKSAPFPIRNVAIIMAVVVVLLIAELFRGGHLASLFGGDKSGASPWQNAYYKILKQQVEATDFNGENGIDVALDDIDGNGIPEMIYKNGNSGAVYTFGENGAVKFEGKTKGKDYYGDTDNLGNYGSIYKVVEDGVGKIVISKSQGIAGIAEELYKSTVSDGEFKDTENFYGDFGFDEDKMKEKNPDFDAEQKSENYLKNDEQSSYKETREEKEKTEAEKQPFEFDRIKSKEDAEEFYKEHFEGNDSFAKSKAESNADEQSVQIVGKWIVDETLTEQNNDDSFKLSIAFGSAYRNYGSSMTFKTNGNFVWGIGAMGESGTYAVKNQEVIEYKASDLNDTEAGIKNNCLKILRENEIRIEQIYDGHKIYWKKAPSNAALKDVLENIVSQVGYPQADNDTERVSGVVYTKLCDMNRDGADELIVLSVRRGKSSTDHGSYTLEIYSTENEKEIKLFSITIDKGWGIFEIGFDYQNNIMMTYYAEDLGTTYCLFFKGTDIQYIGYTSCDDVNKPGGCKRHDHIEKSWIAEGDSLSYAMVDKDDSEYNSVYRLYFV